MKVFIVFAHYYEPQSFVAVVLRRSIDTLRSAGHLKPDLLSRTVGQHRSGAERR
jgi:hypothetical protein